MTQELWKVIADALLETVYMTVASTFGAYVIGLPLGIALTVTDKNGLTPNKILHTVLAVTVNLTRSIPFIIMLLLVTPFTRFLTGTTIGATAALVPLILSAAPYVARLVESSLKEVPSGAIEASESLGATKLNTVFKVIIPEAKTALITGVAIAATTIMGYTAMAGCIAAGGLGETAYQYGAVRHQDSMLYISVILLVVLVQICQEGGLLLAKKLDKRNKK